MCGVVAGPSIYITDARRRGNDIFGVIANIGNVEGLMMIHEGEMPFFNNELWDDFTDQDS
jgi:hypothetical protein